MGSVVRRRSGTGHDSRDTQTVPRGTGKSVWLCSGAPRNDLLLLGEWAVTMFEFPAAGTPALIVAPDVCDLFHDRSAFGHGDQLVHEESVAVWRRIVVG